jgi:TolA-binding protein
LTESELSEPRKPELTSANMTTTAASLHVPSALEEANARQQTVRTQQAETDAGPTAVMIEPRRERPQSPSSWRKYLVPLLVTVVGTLVVFVAGFSLRGWFDELRSVEPTTATGGTTLTKEEAHDSFDQGVIAFNQALYEQAESSFAHAVTLDQGNSGYYHWLGRTQMALKKYADAAQNFLRALEWGGTKDNLLFASAAFQAAGDRLRADEEFKKYLESQAKAP